MRGLGITGWQISASSFDPSSFVLPNKRFVLRQISASWLASIERALDALSFFVLVSFELMAELCATDSGCEP